MDKFADLCAWSLVLAGVVFCITTAKVGAPIRWVFDLAGDRLLKAGRSEDAAEVPRHFVRCPGCVGWWVGLGWSLTRLGWRGPASELMSVSGWPGILGDAFGACAVCWALITTVNR